ncbi:MAG: PadR family transcriptional regulator [Candidatus Sericytochromatia bacterium]|nr:PadR family transcriptional regulator [Candidatus Tanganyikabacteria bacterium]
MFGRGWHGGGPRGRLFEKGDLKYVILDLLSERPRHGYDIIQELEERFRGFYTPSPGSVYPILQMLEDMGLVTVEPRDGRKTYTITAAGRETLAERRPQVDEIWSRLAVGFGHPQDDMHALWHDLKDELRELALLFGKRALARHIDAEKVRRIHAVISRARKEIEAILSS